MVGLTYIPTMDEAYKIAQILAVIGALVLTVQTIIIRYRRGIREQKLADMVARAHQKCSKAQAGDCPLKKELDALEKLS